MTKVQKYSVPGDRKVTHGKPSSNPNLRALTIKEAEELGIPIRRDLVISPMSIKNSDKK